MARAARVGRELVMLAREPPHGISCWTDDGAGADSLENLQAQVVGPADTPYEGGVFRLSVQIPVRYPFEPPKVRFTTRIYHPNIDTGGRICLDLLKMPPAGGWKPSISLATLLTSIQLLMGEANPDDGLLAEVAAEYKFNRAKFDRTAKEWTRRYASKDANAASAASVSSAAAEASGTADSTAAGDSASRKRQPGGSEQEPVESRKSSKVSE